MIEAVHSVLSNAQAVRASADQSSSTRSFAADPENSVSVPQAPYISPYIVVNANNKAVLQIRDSDTGDVLTQYPSETRLQAQSAALSAEPAVSSGGGGVESAGSGDTTGVSVSFSVDVPSSGENVALAQAASAALATGARSGVESLSAGVSVVA